MMRGLARVRQHLFRPPRRPGPITFTGLSLNSCVITSPMQRARSLFRIRQFDGTSLEGRWVHRFSEINSLAFLTIKGPVAAQVDHSSRRYQLQRSAAEI